MNNSKFSWYLKATEPKRLLIGPAGHGTKDWRELEAVATPDARRSNPFYMEAEAQCVIARHQLTLPPQSVAYVVPGVSKHVQTFTPEFFKAYDELRAKFGG